MLSPVLDGKFSEDVYIAGAIYDLYGANEVRYRIDKGEEKAIDAFGAGFSVIERGLSEGIHTLTIYAVNKKGIKGKLFPENTLIISTSATIGEYALITKEFLCNQRFTCLIVKGEYKNILLPMFLKHYAYILSKKCKENIKIGNFPSVDMDKFKKFFCSINIC